MKTTTATTSVEQLREAAKNITVYKKSKRVIYAYTTPGYPEHDGMIKIGETTKTPEERIAEQTHTSNIRAEIQWTVPAIKHDGTPFRDHDFHRYLKARGVSQLKGTEWFSNFSGNEASVSYSIMLDFLAGVPADAGTDAIEYTLRDEQQAAVDKMQNYFENGGTDFLLNAKPRFGKTLTMYDLIKKMDFDNSLILTNRPAIANSWLSDYMKFVTSAEGRHFVSTSSALTGKLGVKTPEDFALLADEEKQQIAFVSLQDLKGSTYFGGNHDKLQWVANTEWDLVIFDEAHEARDTELTQIALSVLNKKRTVALSGTPFKMLRSGEFTDENIADWTNEDEQQVKMEELDYNDMLEIKGSDAVRKTAHIDLPTMALHVFKMSDSVSDKIEAGIALNNEYYMPVINISTLFAVKNSREFLYEDAVDDFLNTITSGKNHPYSTMEAQETFAHTFWLLPSIEAVKLIAKKIKKHPVLRQYFPVIAAGNTAENNDFVAENGDNKAIDLVKTAIKKHDKTITLSVGQLTTGVTVEEWSAVLFLTNIQSPELYMQTAARCQNPYAYTKGDVEYRKNICHVFDYSQLSTFDVIDRQMLSHGFTPSESNTVEYKQNLGKVLNSLFVFSETESGEMETINYNNFMQQKLEARRDEVRRNGFSSAYMLAGILDNPTDEVIEALLPLAKNDNVLLNDTSNKTRKNSKADNGMKHAVVHEDAIARLIKKLNQFTFSAESLSLFDEKVTKEIAALDLPDLTPKKINDTVSTAANNVSDFIDKQKTMLNLKINNATAVLDEGIEMRELAGADTSIAKERKRLELKKINDEFNSLIEAKINDKIMAEHELVIKHLEAEQAAYIKRQEVNALRELVLVFVSHIPELLMVMDPDLAVTTETFIESFDEDEINYALNLTKEQFTLIMNHINKDAFEFTVAEYLNSIA